MYACYSAARLCTSVLAGSLENMFLVSANNKDPDHLHVCTGCSEPLLFTQFLYSKVINAKTLCLKDAVRREVNFVLSFYIQNFKTLGKIYGKTCFLMEGLIYYSKIKEPQPK